MKCKKCGGQMVRKTDKYGTYVEHKGKLAFVGCPRMSKN